MLELAKAYWIPIAVTLVAAILSFFGIPLVDFAMIILLSASWFFTTANLANREQRQHNQQLRRDALQQAAGMGASRNHAVPMLRTSTADESLQTIMDDVDTVIGHEVDIVRRELTQVKELVAEAIDTLNNSFSGLHSQTQQEYKMVLTLLDNYGGQG